ncbi:Metallo-hydrolase/oxidoreductase [Lophiostoma macrostomum CBS 122681]|uniref:Metallo-hydrolase/oxidoreductase n=1 Tax=Lophiostoma macrostomum CBS 122681 TaxID=1314788 RepID=A0A6A6TV90_9PLEO|nr:Metallo-hydrolase/oxidoreductase [Lophiostoma macrostomum CBS 122681]
MLAAEHPRYPLPDTDAYIHLSLLDGGSFIGDYSKIHAGVSDETFRMYNWAFYIRHQDRHMLWDLGLDGDKSCYTPWVNKYLLDEVNHVGPRKPIVQQLSERGVLADQIDSVLFSHAHWDHSRPIRDEFPNATAYFGPGTKEGCSPGHIADPDLQWDGRFFDPERATERWAEFSGPWEPFGPFERALNYFGDGSFWVIQAPGHMAGNLCAAARIEGGHWVLLGSDCSHSRQLLDGTYEISQFCLPGGVKSSLHADIPAARSTMAKIRLLENDSKFHVALAHDASWMKKGTDAVLCSLLDDHMKQAARERIPNDEVP